MLLAVAQSRSLPGAQDKSPDESCDESPNESHEESLDESCDHTGPSHLPAGVLIALDRVPIAPEECWKVSERKREREKRIYNSKGVTQAPKAPVIIYDAGGPESNDFLCGIFPQPTTKEKIRGLLDSKTISMPTLKEQN